MRNVSSDAVIKRILLDMRPPGGWLPSCRVNVTTVVTPKFMCLTTVQDGSSGGTLCFDDVETNVPSQYSLLILQCNFQFDVNKM